MIDAVYPAGWNRGELLNLQQYGDGSFAATRLGEDYDARTMNGLRFASGYEAQEFVSWWYAPANVRMGEDASLAPIDAAISPDAG